MPPQTEILVHISGPSRGSDDERYRREARGLLNFEPVHTHTISRNIVLPKDFSTHEGIELSASFPSDPLQDEGDPRPGQTPLPLSVDVARTRSILLKELQAITPAHVSTLKRPLETPAAANAAVASPVQPWTGVKETPRLLVERTPFPPRPRTAPDTNVEPCGAAAKGKQPLRRTQSDSWQTPPSVVPDSQPQQSSSDEHRTASSPIMSTTKRAFFQSSSPSPDKLSSPPAKRARPNTPSPPSTNLLDILSSGSLTPTATSSSQDQPSLPLPTLLPRTQRQSRQTSPSPHPPSTYHPLDDDNDDNRPSSPLPLAPLLPSSSQDNIPPSASSAGTTLSDLPLLIEPPRPRVGHALFKTHLTKHLYVLFKLPALHRYRLPPSSFRRAVAKLERGHWRIPLSGMDEGRKVKFWRYLMEYVGQGKAGWGVRCARETIPAAKEGGSGARRRGSGSDKENVTPEEGGEMEKRVVDVALVYCWGEVIEHVWLVLFLAGKHRVRGVGARWIDSVGKVVVEAE